jgi:UPF0716 family protein affecting phage T7 exclusion
MWKVFDIVMRIFSSLLGVLLIAMGGIWVLQGLNLAFNQPMAGGHPSFMVGDSHWIVYGVILALFGVGQVVWSNRRQVTG